MWRLALSWDLKSYVVLAQDLKSYVALSWDFIEYVVCIPYARMHVGSKLLMLEAVARRIGRG